MAAASPFSDDILTEIFIRLPEKSLLRLKCVHKSWHRLIKSPHFVSTHSDHQKNKHDCMYMLVHLVGADDRNPDMVLYRIDPLHGLQHDSRSTHLHHLRPLLVFPRTSEELGLSCIKFGSKLFFFGLDYLFSMVDFYKSLYGEARVHVIEEKELMAMEPDENNLFSSFRSVFTTTKNPMHGCKYAPICFVVDDKLFVLSRRQMKTAFEVFSPVDETWEALPSPYDVEKKFEFVRACHLVSEKDHTAYFASFDGAMSFNL